MHSGSPNGHEHRLDIEGLRGVAIIAVLAVHAWPDLLRGGFVGVDIFFVLSGFLITGFVFDALAHGQFSILDFYHRRVLRLFPALCTVLLFCLMLATFTFPSEARQIGRHVAASSVFASNIALWSEAGYFDAASDSKPLLHLWSLGIEEQFYLLWPLAAMALFRWRQHAFKVIVLVAVLSFTLNVIWVVPKAKGTFFLLPTRAWELLVGAALASLQHGRVGPAALSWLALWPRLRPALAWAGAALIAAAFALLDKHAPFPGWWALLPTLGTAMLLAGGRTAWFNRRVLSHPLLVFYGSISYPLYLWHWPLLVFPMLLGFQMDVAMRALVLAASVALASLTTDYIERPIRFGQRGPHAPWALVGAMSVVGLGGLVLQWSDGMIGTYPHSVQEIARAELDPGYGGYRSHHCFLDLNQGPASFAQDCWPAGASAANLTLLWGDSHAASLYPGLAALLGQGPPVGALAQFTKAACPPVREQPLGASTYCQETNEHVWRRVSQRPPDTVVLAGNWAHYLTQTDGDSQLLPSLRDTVTRLKSLGVRQVIVIGQMPIWNMPLPRLLLREWTRAGAVPERSLDALDRRALETDRSVRQAIAGSQAVFVSPFEQLCDAQGCLVSQTTEGVSRPLFFDGSHLTSLGSIALVQRSRASLAE